MFSCIILSNEGMVAVVGTITATAKYCKEVMGALSRNDANTPCCSGEHSLL